MRVVCKEQHTSAWMQARTGIVTASRMSDAMAKLSRKSKNGEAGDWAAAHWKYVSELAWERITGVCADHYVSKPMDIGTQFEGEARVEYWQRFGVEPDQTGFVLHPQYDFLGSSPDGLVGEDGGLEIKVPLFHNHVAYLEADEIPEEYMLQMYTNMLCCGDIFTGPIIDSSTGLVLPFDGGFIRPRQWWDFVSYCPPDVAPELPDEFRMFRKRLAADPNIFAAIENAATVTMEHVAERMEKLRAMYPGKDAPKSKFRQQLESAVLADELSESEAYEAAAGYIDGLEVTP